VSLTDLEEQQAALAGVQLSDFRSANLFRLVAERIPKGSSVLDVGCGAGGLVGSLLEAGYDARGIDTSDATVATARAFLSSLGHDPSRLSVAETSDLITAGELADVVACMDCLEHVADDQRLFDDLVALVRPGGRLVVTVPAMMSLYGERDRRIGHYRRYAREQLAALAANAPVEVEELRYWNFLGVAPTYLSQRIFNRNVNEGFRYGPASLGARAMRSLLDVWFRQVENRMVPPRGLTLILTASRVA
jgi:SAM-dependent methyltransferase